MNTHVKHTTRPQYTEGVATGQFSLAPNGDSLSFVGVEDHEQIQAQSIVDEQMRQLTKSSSAPNGLTFREHARLTRYFCAVKIYIRPEELKEIDMPDGSKQKLYIPDSVRAEDRFQSCVGLVVSLGPQAFQNKDGKPRGGGTYKVGDWVLFPRTDIIRVDFNGVALGIMTDDRVIAVVSDPTHWSQSTIGYKA